MFDWKARELYERAHALLRAKFPSAERLPYYNLFRERAVQRAVKAVAAGDPEAPRAAETATRPVTIVEARLVSNDGMIVGKPDHLDGERGEVVDYKTGTEVETYGGVVTEAEAKQLRLYAYLASENGVEVTSGVIMRGDGQRAQLQISPAEAQDEAESARQLLNEFNRAAETGSTFDDLASPSCESCRNCPCIPFCEAFWVRGQPAWESECGAQLEGSVTGVSESTAQGIRLLTLDVDVRRGTVPPGLVSIEQVPEAWMALYGSAPPQVGDRLRVVHGRLSAGADTRVVRVDKTATALWTLPGEATGKHLDAAEL